MSALSPFPARSLLGVLGDLTEHGGCAGRTGGNNGAGWAAGQKVCAETSTQPYLPAGQIQASIMQVLTAPVGVTTTALGGLAAGCQPPCWPGQQQACLCPAEPSRYGPAYDVLKGFSGLLHTVSSNKLLILHHWKHHFITEQTCTRWGVK